MQAAFVNCIRCAKLKRSFFLHKQKNKESKAAAESNASVSNKNKNTQRLQEILQSLEEKIILANNYKVRSNVHPQIVKLKIYDMAKERFPNHVDYNAISVQHYSSQKLVYEVSFLLSVFTQFCIIIMIISYSC